MRTPSTSPGPSRSRIERVAFLGRRVGAIRERGITPRQAAVAAMTVITVCVVTGLVRPLPWQLQLFAPGVAGGVAWLLARRWGDDPEVVAWGLLGLFAGVSAAQKMDIPALVVPLGLGGTIIGIALTVARDSTGPAETP